MIEINLLPHDLRVSKEKKSYLSPKYFLYLIPPIAGVILFIHLLLGLLWLTKGFQLGLLERNWQRLAPQRESLEKFRQQYEFLSQDAVTAQQLLKERVEWSKKLNKISLDLPNGVWLNDISVSGKNVTIRGSSVSLKKEGIGLINRFMENLKKDEMFIKDFSNFELNSILVRNIGGYDTEEFVLSATLK